MTSEQERLVLENMKLVPYIYHRQFPKSELVRLYEEELISEGYVGLIKAVKSFRPDRGYHFSTFAGSCIRNQMLYHLRGLKKFGDKERLLSAPICQAPDGDMLRYEDVLIDGTDYAGTVSALLDAQNVILTKREQEILKLKSRGCRQKEIAEKLGITQSHVSRLLTKIKNKLSG